MDEAHQYQYRGFTRVTKDAASISTMETMMAEDGDLELVPAGSYTPADPAEGIAAEEVPAQFGVWKALPVHPKVGCMFLGGKTPREAVKVVAQLYHAIPVGEREGLEPIIAFIRQAATADDAGESILLAKWTRKDPFETPRLEEWYLALCEAYAPESMPKMAQVPVPPVRDSNQPAAAEAPAVAENGQKEPYKQAYNQGELARLYGLCGILPMSEGDYTVGGLPEFWREFEMVRGKFHSARSHVEHWFEHKWPADAPRHQRFISTSLLKDLVALDFDGQDTWLHYSKRHEGLSVFSVYPLADNSDPGDKRRKAKAYEDTMDNHRPGEREEMEKMSGGLSTIPSSRLETWHWVQYFAAAVETIFGRGCPLLAHLRRYKSLLNTEVGFRNFHAEEWKCYFWKYHVAVRAYFNPGGNGDPLLPFSDFMYRVRQGQGVTRLEVPAELLGRSHASGIEEGGDITPVPLRGGGGGGGLSRNAGGTDGGNSSVAKKCAAEWAKALSKPIKDAEKAVKAAGGRWNLMKLYTDSASTAFGNMMSVVRPSKSGEKDPCPRLFSCGKCRTKGCKCAHQFVKEPTAEQAKSFIDWVKARCAEIKANPLN